jgi:hypothetical protein
MASSHEILASPHETPAEPGQRRRWAHNLRVLVIAVVVVWHTATAYLGGSDWYYMDQTTWKVWTTAVFPAYVISVFALGPLLLVAGWFSARSLAAPRQPLLPGPRPVPGAGCPTACTGRGNES